MTTACNTVAYVKVGEDALGDAVASLHRTLESFGTKLDDTSEDRCGYVDEICEHTRPS